MIATILTIGALALLGGVQVFQYFETKDAVCNLTSEYSLLSDQNKQDLTNAVLLQNQLEQLSQNLQNIDLKSLSQNLSNFKNQISNLQNQQSSTSSQYTSLLKSLNDLKTTTQNNFSSYDDLKKISTNLQNQYSSLLQQSKQFVLSSQQQSDIQDIKNQINSITTKVSTINQGSQAISQSFYQLNLNRQTPGSSKLNIAPSGKKNPDSNALYQFTTDKDSDAILSTRVKNDSSGNPFTSYDHEGVTGWSTGMDVQDNHNFSLKNNWTFDGKPIFTVDKLGNVGIGQDISRPQKFKLDVSGNSKFGQVNVNTTDPGGAKINVVSSGANNPDINGVYIKASDQNTDALVTTRVPKGSKSNPAITFDQEGVSGYQMGMSTSQGNPFVLARNWNKLESDPAYKVEPDGGFTIFSDNFRVCNRGGDYKQCKTYPNK